ncbi:hypothetical protein GQ457_02G016750 [Hibiscus cannabinus]
MDSSTNTTINASINLPSQGLISSDTVPQSNDAGDANTPWYIDSGATHHVTHDPTNIQSATPYQGSGMVSVGNGNSLAISHVGHTFLKTPHKFLLLYHLLHVPNITKNLMFVSRFAKDNSVYFEFHPNVCFVKDEDSGDVLLEGVEKDGLYYFPDTPSQDGSKLTSLVTTSNYDVATSKSCDYESNLDATDFNSMLPTETRVEQEGCSNTTPVTADTSHLQTNNDDDTGQSHDVNNGSSTPSSTPLRHDIEQEIATDNVHHMITRSKAGIFKQKMYMCEASETEPFDWEYFTRVGIGSPTEQFYMVLDTGSDVNWIQCEPCSECYQQYDPIFDPSTSSSYSQVSCDSSQCSSLQESACHDGKCFYQVRYGDGSYTVGDFVTETVSFGNSGNINGVALGCGHTNEGLFVAAAGLLGLDGGPLSMTSQIKATSFSYCLVDRDSTGSSTLDFITELPGDSVVAPLIRSRKVDTFYYVGLTGLSVGGQPVQLPSGIFDLDQSGIGGVIVDCSTAITRLQTQAYNALRDAFVSLTRDLPATSGVALFDTCYDLSSRSSVRVPTVAFVFGNGKSLDLPAKNYLIPVDSAGTYCFAFAPSSSLSIIGNVQQQGTRVSLDLASNLVGFFSNKGRFNIAFEKLGGKVR